MSRNQPRDKNGRFARSVPSSDPAQSGSRPARLKEKKSEGAELPKKKLLQIYILDSSPSMTEHLEVGKTRWQFLQEQLKANIADQQKLTENFIVDYKVVMFGSATTELMDMNPYNMGSISAMRRLGSGTNIFLGMQTVDQAAKSLFQQYDDVVVMLFTDGEHNSSEISLPDARRLVSSLKEKKFPFVFIACGGAEYRHADLIKKLHMEESNAILSTGSAKDISSSISRYNASYNVRSANILVGKEVSEKGFFQKDS